MNSTIFRGLFFAGVAAFVSIAAFAHPGHVHLTLPARTLAQATPDAIAPGAPGVSGQGDLQFKVLYTGSHLPPEAVAVLTKAHGGFAVDRREGKGETYFALPGAGVIVISADLKSTRMLKTAPEMRDTNMHNTTIWYTDSGEPYLVFPGNESNKVFTTTLAGDLVNTLDAPTADLFDNETVKAYFQAGEKFVPTDVDQLAGLYYITTGYSKLDFVLTATVAQTAPISVTWNKLVFGGRGEGPGQFGTGHGVTISPERKRVDVADRPNAQIDRFSPEGSYLDTVSLPEGSYPCDIDYASGYAIVGCLHGPDREKGAPIYLLKDDQLVSTIMPKEELGLVNFQHIHNATMLEMGGKLYIIAQAWNPGDFAILEQAD